MCNARTKTIAPATSGPACDVYATEHQSGVGSYVSVGAGQLAESIRLVYLVHWFYPLLYKLPYVLPQFEFVLSGFLAPK